MKHSSVMDRYNPYYQNDHKKLMQILNRYTFLQPTTLIDQINRITLMKVDELLKQ
jgi:phenolic acid decarboxylase